MLTLRAMNINPVVGRFAPSPTGRMHLGNIFAALMSWLAARAEGGRWILRIEDLDPQRSRREYALRIEDDLRWLGLDWDEGGTDAEGPNAPYCQSERSHLYSEALARLRECGVTYPCRCTRADRLASSAPHASDGRTLYSGRCRPTLMPSLATQDFSGASTRLWVGEESIRFDDLVCGSQEVALERECGDFVLQRADGAWAYQLAVVVDDAAMGVTQVVRGGDLLLSAAQQIYLYRLLGLPAPQFAHLPLLVNDRGQRLSKRDASMSMESLRSRYSPQEIIGYLAYLARLIPKSTPISAAELLTAFSFRRIAELPNTITVGMY